MLPMIDMEDEELDFYSILSNMEYGGLLPI